MTTKIKARRMYATPDFFRLSYSSDKRYYTKPVHVIDASRYQEMVDQMAAALYEHPWKSAQEFWKKKYRLQARAALRSIGIVKGKK